MTDIAETKAMRATALDEVELLRREVETRLGRTGSDRSQTSGPSPASRIGSTIVGGLTGLQISSLIPAGAGGSTATGLRHRHYR